MHKINLLSFPSSNKREISTQSICRFFFLKKKKNERIWFLYPEQSMWWCKNWVGDDISGSGGEEHIGASSYRSNVGQTRKRLVTEKEEEGGGRRHPDRMEVSWTRMRDGEKGGIGFPSGASEGAAGERQRPQRAGIRETKQTGPEGEPSSFFLKITFRSSGFHL